MFGRLAVGCITTAIIFVATIERSSGAAAAFSDDGNHVYLLGSNLTKGTVLDVDLINFTTKKLNLGRFNRDARDCERASSAVVRHRQVALPVAAAER